LPVAVCRFFNLAIRDAANLPILEPLADGALRSAIMFRACSVA
jgi:hypothetical protein